MENPIRTNAVDVLHFINEGSQRKCSMSAEFAPFWKACTEEEKTNFGEEARAMIHPNVAQAPRQIPDFTA